MSAPKKGDLSSSEKELFEVITAGKPLRLKLIPVEPYTGVSFFVSCCMFSTSSYVCYGILLNVTFYCRVITSLNYSV